MACVVDLMSAEDNTLLWSRVSVDASGWRGVDDALGGLDCNLCGAVGDWVDVSVWASRNRRLFPTALPAGFVWFCGGCRAADDDTGLWAGALVLALERSDVLGRLGSPMFVSVCSPKLRPDNHRVRWLQFLS